MATLVTVPVFDMLLSFPLDDPQTSRRGSENFNVIGKLAAGATRPQLDAELGDLRTDSEISVRDIGAAYKYLFSSRSWLDAIAIVLVVALAAGLLPARTAASVDPMEALRQD